MIVKKPEPGHYVRLRPDPVNQPLRVRIAFGLVHTQNIRIAREPQEMWVERLAMTVQPGECIQVGFQKIGACPHFSKNYKIVEIH